MPPALPTLTGVLPERGTLGELPYLWFWQEYGVSGFYPWHGRHYNIGLEAFSRFPTNGLRVAVDNGTALLFGAREKRRFSLRAEVFEGEP